MAVLRVIFIILVIYYLIRILDRYVVPYLFGKPDKDKKQDIRFNGSEKQKKRFSKEDGEYVDYEEIE